MLFNELPPAAMQDLLFKLAEKHVGPLRLPQVLGTEEKPGLLWYLAKAGFFTHPASSGMNFHLGCLGGLAMHIYNFNWWMQTFINASLQEEGLESAIWVGIPDKTILHLETMRESAFIIALCHDLNKTTIFNLPGYVPNMTTKGQSAYKPYEVNKERVALGHYDSVALAATFIDLKADEVQAIAFSEGKYDYGYRAIEGKEDLLTLYAVSADFLSTKVQEQYPAHTRSHLTLRQGIAQVLGGPLPPDEIMQALPAPLPPKETESEVVITAG